MMPDWEGIREDYARGETFTALERKYAVARSTLRGRARREGWQRRNEQEKKVQCNELSQARMDRVAALADALLGCLERAVEELDTVTESVREKAKKEDGGEVTTDFQRLLPQEKGIIDRGGLKQLTGVLKDLKEVLVLRSEGDTREQEARIAKLQRDLSPETEKSFTVLLEGACQDYAQ